MRMQGMAIRMMALCGLGLGLCVLTAAPAAAQINPFRNYRGPVVSKADIEAAREAAARLLDAPSPHVGAWEPWNGPTGNSGTLTIERIYRRGGHDCRAVQSDVRYRAGETRNFLLQACNVDGRWRLAS
ncbi:MAG: hypothetical protein U1E70_01590 [Acetobacteraceae bacterium]|nr:hypothetical protein [Pseudomonadota bacterium]